MSEKTDNHGADAAMTQAGVTYAGHRVKLSISTQKLRKASEAASRDGQSSLRDCTGKQRHSVIFFNHRKILHLCSTNITNSMHICSVIASALAAKMRR